MHGAKIEVDLMESLGQYYLNHFFANAGHHKVRKSVLLRFPAVCGLTEVGYIEDIHMNANYRFSASYDMLGPVQVECEHGHRLATLEAVGGGTKQTIYRPPIPGKNCLHYLDGPAETLYDAVTGAIVIERWYIHGEYLPYFGRAVLKGEEGLAGYITEYPRFRKQVLIYLSSKLPSCRLLRAMEAANLIG